MPFHGVPSTGAGEVWNSEASVLVWREWGGGVARSSETVGGGNSLGSVVPEAAVTKREDATH